MTRLPQKSIALVLIWQGPWPRWWPAFALSCAANPEVHWIIYTTTDAPTPLPDNVFLRQMSIPEFESRASETLGIPVHIPPTFIRKICDYKLSYPHIFQNDLASYDWVGFCDMDVVWGNIRAFAREDILDKYDVFTSRTNRISGHFCILRNETPWRLLYRQIKGWRDILQDSVTCRSFDENYISDLLLGYQLRPVARAWARLKGHAIPRVKWDAELTTSGATQRDMKENQTSATWADGDTWSAKRERLMYIHFHVLKDSMSQFPDVHELQGHTWAVNHNGIHPITGN